MSRPFKPGHRSGPEVALPLIAALTACVALSGCDTLHGFRRSGIVPPSFTAECIRSTVTTTPGVTSVDTYKAREYAATFDPLIVDRIFYRGPRDGVFATIRLERTPDRNIQFNHEYQLLNHRPAQADLDESRALMRLVEQRIADACNLPQLRSSMVEK